MEETETENKGDENKQISVIANQTGFYNGARRREGDVFFVPAGTTAKWFNPIDPKLADEAKAADEEAALAKQTANQKAIDAAKEADEEAAAKKKAAADEAKKAATEADLEAKAKKTGFSRFIPGAKTEGADDQQASASAESPEEQAKAALASAQADASGDAGAAEDDLA